MNLLAKQASSDIEKRLTVTKRQGWGDELGVWGEQVHPTVYRIDRQQGLTIYHREVYSVSFDKLLTQWERTGRKECKYTHTHTHTHVNNQITVLYMGTQFCKSASFELNKKVTSFA